MSINNEIKRMMSLLESEMGDVKPLLNEQGDPQTPPVEASKSPLERSIATGCWTNKRATTDGKIYTLGKGYVYAFAKIAPEIQAGDKFLKVTTEDGANLYVFEKPSTDPAALSIQPNAYLAVTRNKDVQQDKTKPDPNLNYLTSHGWYCNEFKETKGAATQESRMTQDQVNTVNELASELNMKNDGYSYYTTKSEVEGNQYQTIDLKTGSGLLPVDRLGAFQNVPEKTFFIYRMVGKKTDKGNTVKSIEDALALMGYTNVRPGPMTAEATQGKMIGEFCSTFDCTKNLAVQEYAKNNPTLMVYPMDDEQIAAAEAKGLKVFKSGDVESGAKMSKRDARRSEREFGKTKADRQSCITAISVLGTCAKFNNDKDCQNYIKQQAAKGAITLPTDESGKPINAYQLIIPAYKEILGNCQVLADQIKIPNNMEATFLQLQRSSGPFGLRTATSTPTNTQTNTRNPSNMGVNESLNDSIKSVITETINKNNNKNLDSIIKKNLRKYIG
jgi:hypothetical protein